MKKIRILLLKNKEYQILNWRNSIANLPDSNMKEKSLRTIQKNLQEIKNRKRKLHSFNF